MISLEEIKLTYSLSDKQIEELILYSKEDPLVLKFTSDKKRFKDKESIKQWAAEKYKIYCFSDSKDNLLALVWFSKRDIPLTKFSHGSSLAIRVYGEARGKGLAKDFLNIALKDYQKLYPQRKIWLSCSDNNERAVVVYKKLGFVKVSKANENNKILMVLPQ